MDDHGGQGRDRGFFDPTRRFKGRAELYARHRPGYPGAVVTLLEGECGLTPGSVVADIGSGTGILAEMLLARGCRVFGVEPNADMRAEGERVLASYPGFVSVDARAEGTTLPVASVDIVTAAQAFHWFDRPRARAEFAHILKPGGWVVLLWNLRRKDADAFAVEYERLLLEYATDYERVDHANVTDAVIAKFFDPASFRLRVFPNRQVFDYEALEGRLLSSSYAPAAGHPNHAPMLAALRAVFDRHNEGGTVAFAYDTQVYFGRL
ncbi:MAG: SAM-dependent methyltransferase [Acidobacteria bacterium 37-71-11]|nr:MAG: SAM-dependent methyltransferase [Acidobacteria bacterium 37-71-11]HQT95305.1 class I SAM-dependent methyltransferase [Thermoanaerobaculaceae bacterium]